LSGIEPEWDSGPRRRYPLLQGQRQGVVGRRGAASIRDRPDLDELRRSARCAATGRSGTASVGRRVKTLGKRMRQPAC